MKYSTYIFDFDFTLGDSAEGIIDCINHALGIMGYPPERDERICKTIGMTLPNAFTALTNIEDETMRTRFTTLFIERADTIMSDTTTLYDDTIPTLRELRAMGRKLGIVTTKHHHRICEILAKFQLTDNIDVIVGGDDVKHQKPDPEALRLCIRQLKTRPQEVLYVGDSVIDARTAADAGVDFAAVTTGTTKKEEFLKFPYVAVVKHLGQIRGIDE